MYIQVTTEAIGKYSPNDRGNLHDVTPPGTSIGTSELIPRNPQSKILNCINI